MVLHFEMSASNTVISLACTYEQGLLSVLLAHLVGSGSRYDCTVVLTALAFMAGEEATFCPS